MSENLKYDKERLMDNGKWLIIQLPIIFCILTFLSCKNNNEPEHLSTKTGDLNGLEQPANQTVFSGVGTILPIQKTISPVLKATGVIAYDPSLLNNISARFGGRIEKLYVRYNFETVSKGQRIMDIYSPEILTEQQNLIYLLNNPLDDLNLVNLSKQKLKLLGVTDEQLMQIEKQRKPINPLPVFSNYSGHIHDIGLSNGVATSPSMNNGMGSGNRNSSNSPAQVQIENLPSSQSSALSIREGMYIEKGQSIFAVYNIFKIWAVLNIFPEDAKRIKVGDKVMLASETNPNHLIPAVINYIEPVVGQNASAIKARVYLENEEEHHLKIGTLVNAKITSTEITGLWLPRKAIVNLGQKQVVFTKTKDAFQAKNISIGYTTDSLVQIVQGLKDSDLVAANAQFMVDSESFIIAKDDE